MEDERVVDGITYIVLSQDKIRNYVIETCQKEWDLNDFPKYAGDLYNSTWKLEEIEVDKISLNEMLLKSEFFQKDVQPRIKKQKELYTNKKPVSPLILRGNDLLIFDGYARYHLFKEIGVKKCLAYVSHAAN